jgi:hypothetical protein
LLLPESTSIIFDLSLHSNGKYTVVRGKNLKISRGPLGEFIAKIGKDGEIGWEPVEPQVFVP